MNALPNRYFTEGQLEVILDMIKQNVSITAFIADAADFPRYEMDETPEDILHLIEQFAEAKLNEGDVNLKSILTNIAAICIMGLVQDYAKFVEEMKAQKEAA